LEAQAAGYPTWSKWITFTPYVNGYWSVTETGCAGAADPDPETAAII